MAPFARTSAGAGTTGPVLALIAVLCLAEVQALPSASTAPRLLHSARARTAEASNAFRLSPVAPTGPRGGSLAPRTAELIAGGEPNLSLRGGDGAGAKNFQVDWLSVASNLFGGLALFLYGMERLGYGLKAAFGQQLRKILLALSFNRVVGFATGLVACGITNSLSLISVLLVEFVSSDLIPLDNCMGILLGACVGSTLICFLVVLKITKLGMLLIALGYLMNQSAKVDKTRQIGMATFGCGVIFYSMDLMSSAFGFMKSHESFLSFLAQMDNPILGIIVSTVVTGLIQSSGATMSILLSLASQGMLGIRSATGLMLGANVGTCVTGMLASIGQPVDGLRLAVALLLFRALGVILLFPFIGRFTNVVCSILKLNPESHEASDVMMYLAWSHMSFNVILSVGAMPFTHHWTRFIRYLVPSKPSPPKKEERGGDKAEELSPSVVICEACATEIETPHPESKKKLFGIAQLPWGRKGKQAAGK